MLGFRRKNHSNRKPDLMVVGLGNPGPEYDGTRHNVGFRVLDAIGDKYKFKLTVFKNRARYVTWELEGKAVLVVKPMAFMNLSGSPIATLARQYGLSAADILVVADDLDLPTGKVKMKPKGGSGGHNGHRSIAAALGTDEYPRIKIGIGKSGETVEHVLSRFTPSEREQTDDAVEKAVQTCVLFVTEGLDSAMQYCNSD